ncbi:MAG: SOS response-associated peptidase [Alphaproteobacteria bacterium]|nr:MAG: SOS response-associated peptidase [Alphaproteobacteria bacterium]
MCNLYTNKKSAAEVAAHFRAQLPIAFNAGPDEVYPGGPGMVVRENNGTRVLQAMTWGFPLRLKSMKPGTKPKPVNNIADLSSFMWRFIAGKPEHRCIIPMTGFCEAEGEKGAKTQTWFSLHERPLFAWAGMWKDSAEWGPVYSGLMTDCNEAIRPVHDRMPVLLHEEDYDLWLRGSLDDVMGFQGRCFPDELIAMERTGEPWFKRKAEGSS